MPSPAGALMMIFAIDGILHYEFAAGQQKPEQRHAIITAHIFPLFLCATLLASHRHVKWCQCVSSRSVIAEKTPRWGRSFLRRPPFLEADYRAATPEYATGRCFIPRAAPRRHSGRTASLLLISPIAAEIAYRHSPRHARQHRHDGHGRYFSIS